MIVTIRYVDPNIPDYLLPLGAEWNTIDPETGVDDGFLSIALPSGRTKLISKHRIHEITISD